MVAAVLLAGAARPALATAPPLSGFVPEPLRTAFQEGLFDVPAPGPLGVSSAQPVWRIPILMVSFSDSALTHTPAEFEFSLFDTTGATGTGSVYDYYRWASGNRLRVIGEVVATVVLPGDRFYYSNDSYGVNSISTPNNDFGLLRDAVHLTDTQVDWSRFDLDADGFVDMVWIIHAGPGAETNGVRRNLWSITSRASTGWSNSSALVTDDRVPGTTTQFIRVDRFSILPELSAYVPGAPAEIGVFAHEFGHALGLPDLYDTSVLGGALNVGPGNWSLMSTGSYGGDNRTPNTPTGLGAWPMAYLRWSETVRPSADTLLTLRSLAAGGPVVEMWFQGESNPEHFLIENRQRIGFDRYLPDSGLIIYQVDDAEIGARLGANRVNYGFDPALRLIESDGNADLMNGRNRADASDPFPGSLHRTLFDDDSSPATLSMSGAVTNLAVRSIQPIGHDVQFLMQVQAPGWLAPEDHTDADFNPVESYGPAPRAVITPEGTIYSVRSELRNGRAQIVLRTKSWGESWNAPLTLSTTTGHATAPTLARLSGSDLAVAWTDSRSGHGQIYYRARVRGTWTPERLMANLAGEASAPAIGADARGTVHLGWLQVEGIGARVMFMRFTYLAPFGQPITVTTVNERPTAPAIASARDGRAYVLWTDRATNPQTIYFSRYHPDSGLSPRFRLAPQSGYSQPSVNALVDTAGTLHTVWQVSGPGINEIHYQRRTTSLPPAPRDTLVDALGDGAQNPVIAMDLLGGLHVAFEQATTGGLSVRYKRWRPERGWDYRTTQVSLPQDGSASNPCVLPISFGDVTVLYTGFDGTRLRMGERRRQLDGGLVASAPPPVPALSLIQLAPNPLRAGGALEARFPAGDDPAPRLEIFDATGRRMAEAEVRAQGTWWRAHLDGALTAGWPAGLYFARLSGERAPARRLVVLR